MGDCAFNIKFVQLPPHPSPAQQTATAGEESENVTTDQTLRESSQHSGSLINECFL